MKKLKENLLKQQELNKELSTLILNLEELDFSSEEGLEIQKISESNIESNLDNIELLRSRYIKLINNKKITARNQEIIKMAITKLDDMKGNYKKLESELLKLEDEVLNNNVGGEIINGLNDTSNLNEKLIEPKSNVKKSEKNIVFYLINFIGLILVILGVSTFGKYVYSNYMNDLSKGISLYITSILILIVGEKLLKNKNPKFSGGITGLGICMLYMSTFINYLFLDNLNEIVTIMISLIISILGIYISHKKDSLIIRIISLIGGLITLIPTNIQSYIDGYNIIKSLMIIFFNIILNILSVYKPIIKNKKIAINAISIINFIFLSMSIFFINEYIIVFLFIFNIAYNHYLFKEDGLENKGSIIFQIINFLIAIISLNLNTVSISILLITYIGLLFFTKRKILYLLNIFILVDFLSYNYINEDIINSLIFLVITLFIAYIDNEKPNVLYKIAYVVELFTLIITTLEFDTITIFLITNSVMFISLFIYIKQKEGKMFKVIKYYSFLNLISTLTFLMGDYNIDKKTIMLTNVIIMGSSIYIFNKINLIKDRNIRVDNIACLFLISILSLSIMNDFNFISLIAAIFITIYLFIFIDEKYIKMNKKTKLIKDIIIPVYIMFNIVSLDNILSNISILILLMILAVSVVYLGFRNRNIVIRRVGIGITIFTILKLLLESFDMNYIGRTITFIIVGLLSLVIAFIYSEIDKIYKDK